MNNKTAIFVALAIIAVFVIDQVFVGADIHVFLAKKLAVLIDNLAFWR